ncbi:MAG: pyridoxal-phosphate dependent enzyme [Acidilobus sp.]
MRLLPCRLVCPRCGYEAEEGELVCPRCGSFLIYECHDIRWSVNEGTPSMWRYLEMMAFRPKRVVSAGEGYTPILRIDDVQVKLETRNPTGSYADRASSAIFSAVPRTSYRVSYSLDFASSFAFYGRLAKASVTVIVDPESLDPFDLINIVRARSSIEFTGEADLRYENQYTIEGLKTISYEIVEQGKRFDKVFVPAGTGLLALAMLKGFSEAVEANVSSQPEIVAVTTKGSSEPALLRLARGVRTIKIEPDDVVRASVRLARRGIYVRPIAAAAFAAAQTEGGLAIITGGLRRPTRFHKALTDLQQKVLEALKRRPEGATAYDVWEAIPEHSLRGIYKALEALVDQGRVCESFTLRGKRKVRIYRVC